MRAASAEQIERWTEDYAALCREENPACSEENAQKAMQALREMARQTMRLESMQLQKSAQAQLEQTRRLEAAMTELTQRQRVDITSRTPDSAAGGMMGSCRRRMEVAGIASGPSQRSMQEISRFFERDARRYG